MMAQTDYQKLQLKDLKLMVGERNIDCKETKEEIIKSLKLYDQEKYVYPTVYEKNNGGFIVGISLNNQSHLNYIGKLIEKKEAQALNIFSNDRKYYWSPRKLI